jgi:hypothetical protein
LEHSGRNRYPVEASRCPIAAELDIEPASTRRPRRSLPLGPGSIGTGSTAIEFLNSPLEVTDQLLQLAQSVFQPVGK